MNMNNNLKALKAKKFISSLVLAILSAGVMQLAQAAVPEIAGQWEHRFKNDSEGDILILRFEEGILKGEYLGLERDDEQVTFYSASELRDLEMSDADISFTVPVRAIFSERPESLEQVRVWSKEWVAGSKSELRFHGRLKNGSFYLECISRNGECPGGQMIFTKRETQSAKALPGINGKVAKK